MTTLPVYTKFQQSQQKATAGGIPVTRAMTLNVTSIVTYNTD